jgi:hypothetical protein
MIRVIAIDDETGTQVELEGSRVVLLVGDGNHADMVTAGDAKDDGITCEMLVEAHEKVHAATPRLPVAATTSAAVH